jgi:uncharacterized protein (DUF58 family)
MAQSTLGRTTASARRRRRWGPPRKLRITRTGWSYLGFTIIVGLAAINTGNNLLFLLLGLLLAGVVLSGILSESTLRALSVERVLPADAQVGKPCLVGVRIFNHKRRASSYAVLAKDIAEAGETGRAFALTIDGGHYKDVAYRWEPAKRGRVEFVRISLGTRFPFGLFEKWRECELPGEAVVFPREVPAPMVLPKRAAPLGETPSNAAGQGQEFFALRDIRAGDDARSIHWVTSARRGRPVVVERERERRRRIAVVVDNRPGAIGSDRDGKAVDERLDRLAEGAAALIHRAIRDGCEVSLATSDAAVPTGAGGAHERRLLRMLALMGPSETSRPPVPSTHADVVELRADDMAPPKGAAA